MARGARPPTATKGKTPAKAAQVCRQRVLEDERLVSAQFGDYRTSYLGDPLKGSGAVMNHRPKLYNPDGSSGQPNPYSYEGQRFMTIETYNSKSACALKVEARHGK